MEEEYKEEQMGNRTGRSKRIRRRGGQGGRGGIKKRMGNRRRVRGHRGR